MNTIYRFEWTLTGDHFDVTPINEEFSEYYADRCIANHTEFKTEIFDQDIKTRDSIRLIELANSDLSIINYYLKKLKLPVLSINNWYDQQELNRLHREWNILLREFPKIEKFIYTANQKDFDKFHSINRTLHQLERSFVYQFRDPKLWREENVFVGKTFPYGTFNVSLVYNDHGRNSMEKFVNFDENPNDGELSPWRTIGPNLKFNLVKPYETSYPLEFLKYCKNHRIPVQDHYIPFGNLLDCKENLARVRELMVSNLSKTENSLILKKVSV